MLLGREDAKELSELENSCFPRGWTFEQFCQILFERKEFDFSLLYPKKDIFLDTDLEDIQGISQYFSRQEIPILGLFGEQDTLVGYVSIRLLGVEAEIYNIAIKNEMRGRAFGSVLMSTALALAKRSNVETVFLEVRESNIPALALYKKMGFFQTGVRKSYYPDGENALLMTCELDK